MSKPMDRRRALMAALKAELWKPTQAKAVVDAVLANAPDDSWIRSKRALKRMAAAIRGAVGGDGKLARRGYNVARRVAAGPAEETAGGIYIKHPGQKPITLWRSEPNFPPEVRGQPLVRYEGFLYPQLAGLEGRVYGDTPGWKSVQWRNPGGAERPWERRDPGAFPANSEALIPIQGWSRAFRRPGESTRDDEDGEMLSTSTVVGAAAGALVAGPVGALIGGVLGHVLGDGEPRLARAVVYNDVLGMGMTDAEARADALARDEDLEHAEYTTGTLAALLAWKNGRPDLVTLAPNGVVHRVDVDDTPEDWKGTGNDPAEQGDDDWRRPRRAPRVRRRRPR